MSHLTLPVRCGACADLIQHGHKVYGLTEDAPLQKPAVQSLVLWNRRSYGPRRAGSSGVIHCACRLPRPNCNLCADNAPPAVIVHKACFQVFLTGGTRDGDGGPGPRGKHGWTDERRALVRDLVLIGTYRMPWPELQHLYLGEPAVPSFDAVDASLLGRLASAMDLPRLATIPKEVLDTIYGLSHESPFWALTAVCSLRLEVETMRKQGRDQLQRALLVDVVSWQRGSALQVASKSRASSLPPFIQITVDRLGIRKVERLSQRPTYAPARHHPQLAYIIEDVRQMATRPVVARTFAELNLGFMRLRPPVGTTGLNVWNARPPPRPDLFTFMMLDVSIRLFRTLGKIPAVQLHTVDLTGPCALTFFFLDTFIYGIHFHKTPEESAMATYDNIAIDRKHALVWVYLPIGPGDHVKSITLYSLPSPLFVFDLKLAGHILAGPRPLTRPSPAIIARGEKITFAYAEPELGRHVQVMGASSGPGPAVQGDPGDHDRMSAAIAQSEKELMLFLKIYDPSGPPDEDPDPFRNFFFAAHLGEVERVRVFVDTSTGMCSGVLLWYMNGGMHALGQCRVGVDTAVDTARPTRIRFRHVNAPTYRPVGTRGLMTGTAVEASNDAISETEIQAGATGPDEGGWVTMPFGVELGIFAFCYNTSGCSSIACNDRQRRGRQSPGRPDCIPPMLQ